MHKIPPSFWLAIFCAVLGAGIWAWSGRLPESVWESSTTAVLPSPAPSAAPALPPEPTPTPAPVANPAEVSAPVAEATPTPQPPSSEAVPATSPEAPVAAAVPPAPSPIPAPSPSEIAAASPIPSPTPDVPVATPTPTPLPPLTVADIARQPQLWPKQLVLLASVRFPVVLNGVNVGNVQAPAGSVVVLHKVTPEGTVEVELRGSKATVKAEATDLLARARALSATAPPALPP